MSLAQQVALFDQLGDDSVSGALGYSNRRGDVAQADAGITSDAHEDMGVIRQKVPASRGVRVWGLLRISRKLLTITGKCIHELMIHYVPSSESRRRHLSRRTRWEGTPSMTVFSALRERLSNHEANQLTSAGDQADPPAETRLPFPGFDRLNGKQVIRGLSDHSQLELEAVEAYERSHQGRDRVLDKLRYMRGPEPLPGYDALGVEEILEALAEADLPTVKRIGSYERKFANRSAVLEEVIRVHHRLRAAQPASAAPRYQPLSATTGVSRRAEPGEIGDD